MIKNGLHDCPTVPFAVWVWKIAEPNSVEPNTRNHGSLNATFCVSAVFNIQIVKLKAVGTSIRQIESQSTFNSVD